MTAESILKDIKAAWLDFGRYTYFDKGAEEVMEIDLYVREMRKMPVSTLKKLLEDLHNLDKDSDIFIGSVLEMLQDIPTEQWDELMKSDILNQIF